MNKQLKELIQSDVKRYYAGRGRPVMWKLLNPNLYYIIIYRKAHFYSTHNKLLYFFYAYKLKKISKKYAFQIPVDAEIGKGLYNRAQWSSCNKKKKKNRR